MILETVVYVLLGIGVFFNLLASLGLVRFPDVYTRLHAGTKCTTFGSIFISAAVMLYGLKFWYLEGWGSGNSILVLHTLIALICILVTNPTGAHAIARAAHRRGIMPFGAVVDDLKDDKKRKASGRKKK